MQQIDKSTWPRGEWDNEPDLMTWDQNGLHCVVMRHVGYGDSPICGASVHGGLTFAGGLPVDESYWFFGFDTAHGRDYQPGMAALMDKIWGRVTPTSGGETYKNLEYVTEEVKRLATYITLLGVAPGIAEIMNE